MMHPVPPAYKLTGCPVPHCPCAAPAFDQEREDFKANFEKLHFVKDGAAKEFIIGVKVGKRAEVVGKTVSAAGLRGIPGLYVLSVDKSDGTSVEASDYLYKIQPVGNSYSAYLTLTAGMRRGSCVTCRHVPHRHVPGQDDGVSPPAVLFSLARTYHFACHSLVSLPGLTVDLCSPQEDVIWVAADITAVGFLSKFPGLQLVQQEQVDKTGTSVLYRHLVQAAVSHKGPLVGQTVRDYRFRSVYNAAVVAVHREGVRVPLKVQDIVLQGGDVLLISCSTSWAETHRHDKAFVLVQVRQVAPLLVSSSRLDISMQVSTLDPCLCHPCTCVHPALRSS